MDTSGTAWAASLGSRGRRTSHIEEALHRAANRRSGDVLCERLCVGGFVSSGLLAYVRWLMRVKGA